MDTVLDLDVVSIPSLKSSLVAHEITRLLPADAESSTYKTGYSFMEAFFRTLICSNFRPQIPQESEALTLQNSMDAIRECLRYGNSAGFEHTWNNRTYISNTYALTKNRAFFETEEGYISMAPRDIKVGDTILAVLSCQSFTVVRPAPGNKGRYNVVGEAFVYGLNDSEALLGPLPEHIHAEHHYHPGRRTFFDAYRDTRTGELSWIDPRHEALGILTEADADGIPFLVEADELEKAGIHLSRFELV